MGANWARHLHADASRIVLTLLRWRVTFRINYRQRESRSPRNIYRHPVVCIRTHTGDNGPTWSSSTPFPPLCPCRLHEFGPHFMLVMPLFPESVYYHRPVSSFMQNNLISRTSKSRYNVAPCALCFALSRFCPARVVRYLSCSSPSVFKLTARENYADSARKLLNGDVAVVIGWQLVLVSVLSIGIVMVG